GRRRGDDRCKDDNLHSHGAHYNPLTRIMLKPIAAFVCAAAVASSPFIRGVRLQPDHAAMVEWPFYGGDQGGAKYSTLTDVNASNVAKLSAAWEWKTGEKALAEFGTRPGNFQVTPLMIDNVLYFSTPYNRVVALDADSGVEKWAYDPKPYAEGQP